MKAIIFGLGSIGTKHLHLLKRLYPNIDLYAYRHTAGYYLKQDWYKNVFSMNYVDDKFDMAFICTTSCIVI